MSQKTGKKLRKHIDDELETCIKISRAEEINNTTQKATENGIQNEDKNTDTKKVEEPEFNGTTDNNLQCVSEVTEEVVHEVVIEDTPPQIEIEQIESEKAILTINNKENEQVEAVTYQSKGTKEDDTETNLTVENQMEPLFLESEEADPELEFEEHSDVDSQRNSPIRCRTRRSQIKYIPGPKKSKILNINNDDKTSECCDKPSVLTVPTPEITDTESELSVFKPVTDVYDCNEKLFCKPIEDDFDSFQNISTKAVVGSDTTRNVELGSYPEEEFELSPFLIQSRERSVGETLKLLSARRSIRTSRDYTLQYNKRDYKTLPSFPKRNAFEKLGGTKRKNNESPDYSKRLKSESPHLLSYISSPIATLKNRFAKSEIPSSTPKLTAYKNKHVFDNTNVSKITLNETEDVAERKWCTMM